MMTIKKQQLIHLLAKKTGLEEQEVKAQLNKLIGRIKETAEQGKKLEIEGLGIFYMEDEFLNFIPADRLETEINNKYAGMKPIELIGAFKGSDSTEESSELEEGETTEDVFAYTESVGTRDSISAPELEKEGDGEDLQESPEKEQAGGPSEEPPVPIAGKDSDEPKDPDKASSKEQDPIGRVLVAAVIVISLGVSGWLTYDLTLNKKYDKKSHSQSLSQPVSEASTNSSEATEPIEEQQQEISNQREEKANEEQSAEQETVSSVSKDEEDRDAEGAAYGLRGSISDKITNGYSIIVVSQYNLSAANNNKRELEQDDFRVVISKARVNGRDYYRVGVGQFETIEDAQNAVKELPEPYRSENFIQRINYQ